jgi:hypothetical protein
MYIIIALAGAVSIAIFFGLLAALPVMLLWDWLMPTLFHLPTITWMQAWGLMILCALLFKTSVSFKKD